MGGSTIQTQNPNNIVNPYQTNLPPQIGQGRQITGTGVIGQGGPTPDAPKPSYSTVLASIARMIPSMVNEVVEILLAEVAAKLKDLESASDNEKVKVDTAEKRKALEQKVNDLKEASKKTQEAIDATKGPFGWLKAIFQAIAAAIMMIVGAVMVATGVGAAAGAALIIGGATMMVSAIDAMVKEGTGHGIAGNIYLASHPGDKEGAGKADMGFAISVAIIGFVGAIASGGAGLAGVAGQIANSMAQNVANLINAATAITSAVIDVAAGVKNYQATLLRADAKRLEAGAKDMEALIQVLDQAIDMALQRLMAAMKRLDEMLDAIVDSLQDRGQSLMRTRFSD